MYEAPYQTASKSYGKALLALARERTEIVCLGADLTRQTETDSFRDTIPDRFFNVGMAEANMIGIAGGLARAGNVVFVNTFGVFCTRRCYDQIAMAVAYPALNVKIVGFMPGLSSPGGPSHQAIEDVALMRALPNMTIIDPADATEIEKAVRIIADLPGPVYLRLKRGESPVVFEEDHNLDPKRAQVILRNGGADVCIIASGMMVPAALAAAGTLRDNGIGSTVLNVPVIKPLDADTIVRKAHASRFVITAENHSVIGGLGSAVAEALAAAAVGVPLHRIGIADVFAESGSRDFLFSRYGLDTQSIVNAAWRGIGRNQEPPRARAVDRPAGAYAPV